MCAVSRFLFFRVLKTKRVDEVASHRKKRCSISTSYSTCCRSSPASRQRTSPATNSDALESRRCPPHPPPSTTCIANPVREKVCVCAKCIALGGASSVWCHPTQSSTTRLVRERWSKNRKKTCAGLNHLLPHKAVGVFHYTVDPRAPVALLLGLL